MSRGFFQETSAFEFMAISQGISSRNFSIQKFLYHCMPLVIYIYIERERERNCVESFLMLP